MVYFRTPWSQQCRGTILGECCFCDSASNQLLYNSHELSLVLFAFHVNQVFFKVGIWLGRALLLSCFREREPDMAGKGKKTDLEANPFSFKNFVSGGPGKSGDFVSDDEDEKPFPDASSVVKSKPLKTKTRKASAKTSKPGSVVAPAVDLFADDGDDPLTGVVEKGKFG